MLTTCVNEFVARSHRYKLPSSLPAYTESVPGSTTAELMHHSSTALTYFPPSFRNSVSGVMPAMGNTSFITAAPVSGSVSVAVGARIGVLFTPRYDDVPVYEGTIDAGTTLGVSSQPKAPGVFSVVRLPEKCNSQPRS